MSKTNDNISAELTSLKELVRYGMVQQRKDLSELQHSIGELGASLQRELNALRIERERLKGDRERLSIEQALQNSRIRMKAETIETELTEFVAANFQKNMKLITELSDSLIEKSALASLARLSAEQMLNQIKESLGDKSDQYHSA
jgi:hypothetical protein